MSIKQGLARLAPVAGMLLAVAAQAGSGNLSPGGSKHNPTYFGRWGAGVPLAYGKPAPVYDHPWTGKVFGFRYERTPEEAYADLARKYQIEQARHIAYLENLDYKAYDDYMNPKPNSLAGYLGKGCGCSSGGCSDGRCGKGGGNGHCGSCGKAGCNGGCGGGGGLNPFANAGCKGGKCGKKHGDLHHALFGGNRSERAGADYPVTPPPYGAYPAMTPEDATRYIEGMQYYPPTQSIRSPRDFFMFDTKYNLGR